MPDFSRTRLRRKHVSLQGKYMPCSLAGYATIKQQTSDGRRGERAVGRGAEKKEEEEHGKRKE